jgi:predicted esterase
LRRSPWIVVLSLVATALVAPGAEASGRVVDGLADDWAGKATMVPGTASYDAGEWAFTDYPYDDVGPGGYVYPKTSTYGCNSNSNCKGNAADPVVLRISADDAAVHYLVELDTLVAPDTTVVALAVDTDLDETTGGGAWPLGAGVTTTGWEHVVTVWGTGGRVDGADGSSQAISAAADLTLNRIEFAVPRSFADPGTSTWRYHGAAGLWDGDSWWEVAPPPGPGQSASGPVGKTDPSWPNVFNLLFRSRIHDGGTAETDENPSGGFQSARQQAALRSGDLGPFAREVDFGLLASGASVFPEEPAGDVHITRVYASRGFPNAFYEGTTPSMSLEGMDIGDHIYNGRFQPYRMFVPSTYREDPSPAPLLPMLHGWGGDHRGFNPSSNAFWTDVVRPRRALVAKPLGAGNRVWYEHLGELDVLEVIRDVSENYAVDEDRIYLSGVSMGGLGTIKIAEAHPDLFAGIFPSVPPMSDRAAGYAVPAANDWDLVEHAESLFNVPVRNFTGTYDALVPGGNDSRRFCDRLKQLYLDHVCWRDISEGGTHRGFEADRAADIAELMDTHTRDRDPDYVVYEVHPVWTKQAQDKGIDEVLTYDGAYWVSRIEPLGAALPEALDCRAPQTMGELCFGTLAVVTQGRGLRDLTFSPVGDDPSPTIIRDGIKVEAGERNEPSNSFTATVANLRGFDLDLGRMNLTLGEPLSAVIVDRNFGGPFELGLLGAGAHTGCGATLDGTPVPTSMDGDRLELDLDLNGRSQTLNIDCG